MRTYKPTGRPRGRPRKTKPPDIPKAQAQRIRKKRDPSLSKKEKNKLWREENKQHIKDYLAQLKANPEWREKARLRHKKQRIRQRMKPEWREKKRIQDMFYRQQNHQDVCSRARERDRRRRAMQKFIQLTLIANTI